MRNISIKACASLLACLFLAGCATMRYPSLYKVEGEEVMEFKDLDDDKALKTVALIYNCKHECWDDNMARSIALEKYQSLLASRNSKYIKDSGIFDIKYQRVNVSSLGDEDLVVLCDCLKPKIETCYMAMDASVSEQQNAQRIVYLTAASVVVGELKKRSMTRQAMSVAGQLISAALTVAMALI